jgi:hypothetical protein
MSSNVKRALWFVTAHYLLHHTGLGLAVASNSDLALLFSRYVHHVRLDHFLVHARWTWTGPGGPVAMVTPSNMCHRVQV